MSQIEAELVVSRLMQIRETDKPTRKTTRKIYIIYDNLPEEEQLLMDVLQARLDILNTRLMLPMTGLLKNISSKYWKKATCDLLIIDLYFFLPHRIRR